MKILCKILGHDFDRMDILMNKIKRSAINSNQLTLTPINCKRCGVPRKDL